MVEAEEADREAMEEIFELVTEGWTADDAIAEVVNVRKVFKAGLAPREKYPKQGAPPRWDAPVQRGSRVGPYDKGSGKGGGKKGPVKGNGKAPPGLRKGVCWRFQNGTCRMGDQCRFSHE